MWPKSCLARQAVLRVSVGMSDIQILLVRQTSVIYEHMSCTAVTACIFLLTPPRLSAHKIAVFKTLPIAAVYTCEHTNVIRFKLCCDNTTGKCESNMPKHHSQRDLLCLACVFSTTGSAGLSSSQSSASQCQHAEAVTTLSQKHLDLVC